MSKENKQKTAFFPNLGTVKKAIHDKEFEKEIVHVEIEWDKIADATLEALTKQTILNLNLCNSIIQYAEGECDEDPKIFIDLVEQFEFIITELLNDGLILQVNQNPNDTPF